MVECLRLLKKVLFLGMGLLLNLYGSVHKSYWQMASGESSATSFRRLIGKGLSGQLLIYLLLVVSRKKGLDGLKCTLQLVGQHLPFTFSHRIVRYRKSCALYAFHIFFLPLLNWHEWQNNILFLYRGLSFWGFYRTDFGFWAELGGCSMAVSRKTVNWYCTKSANYSLWKSVF